MALPTISGEFTVAGDPTLRFTASGMAMCKLRVVANKKKKVNDEWVDDKSCWLDATGFGKLGENMAESFAKGDRVILNGQLQTETWEDSEGNKRLSVECVLYTIGPAVTFNPARTQRSERSSGEQAPASDPWTSGQGGTEDPPF